jgi:hypothetical protein
VSSKNSILLLNFKLQLLLTAGIADVWAWSSISPVKMMNKNGVFNFFEDYI